MYGRSLRSAALMIGGALVLIQVLATVLESQARPRTVDDSFIAEIQHSQHSAGSRFSTPPRKP